MRTDFADIVEHVLEDPGTAESIRAQLMGEWTRVLMRELAVEIHRAQGFDVSWEYVDVDVDGRAFSADEEEEEDLFEDGDENEQEMDTESEYEEDEDETDEDDDEEMEI